MVKNDIIKIVEDEEERRLKVNEVSASI